jgi:preprotein translocase subunit SecD
VVVSVLAIGMKYYPYGRNGIEIVYVSKDSPAKNILLEGMQITELNSQIVKDLADWKAKTSSLAGLVSVRADNNIYNININGSIGIDAMDIERTNLDFGLDLRGGTRVVLKPKGCIKTDVNATSCTITRDIVNQIIGTLQTRSNMYGLKDIKFYALGSGDDYYIQVEAAGIGRGVVDQLLSAQGKFEAKIDKPLKIDNGRASLILETDTYAINVLNDSLEINGSVVYTNQTFTLKNIVFQYVNRTESTLNLFATVYEGKDIELVYTDPQKSGIAPRNNVYEFYFVVLVSAKGAERFAIVTAGIPKHVDIYSGEEYLDSKIYLYLDDGLVSDLRIGSSLGGQVYTTPQIQGAEKDLDSAVQEKLRLQTILRSGALPTSLETVSVDVIPPTLGSNFFMFAIYSGLFAALSVAVVIFIRYRKIKPAIFMTFTVLCEVLIILGIASSSDYLVWGIALVANMAVVIFAFLKKQEIDALAWIGALLIPLLGILVAWTVDLSAIGGIIATIGTGVDHLIIITDETMRKKEEAVYTFKEKIKAAFFMVFGAASTVIAAMVPLLFLGIGLVKGFAITTIIGVLVGILITRPAYANIVEALHRREEKKSAAATA